MLIFNATNTFNLRLLPGLFCGIILLLSQPLHAQDYDGCGAGAKRLGRTLQKLETQYGRCLTLKQNELENIKYKRARYLRLITWAGDLGLGDSLRQYIDGLRQYDLFIDVKTTNFSSCTAALPGISTFNPIQSNSSTCSEQTSAMNKKIGDARNSIKACRTCGLAGISAGINHSAFDLIVIQQRNARKIRQKLYRKLNRDNGSVLSTRNPWIVYRDVDLAYIADLAVEMGNSQKLIIVMEQLEHSIESKDKPDKSTDKIVAVYEKLAKTLKSDDTEEEAKEFWNQFVDTLKTDHAQGYRSQYVGIRSAEEFSQYVSINKARFHDTLVAALDNAVDKYRAIKQSQ